MHTIKIDNPCSDIYIMWVFACGWFLGCDHLHWVWVFLVSGKTPTLRWRKSGRFSTTWERLSGCRLRSLVDGRTQTCPIGHTGQRYRRYLVSVRHMWFLFASNMEEGWSRCVRYFFHLSLFPILGVDGIVLDLSLPLWPICYVLPP